MKTYGFCGQVLWFIFGTWVGAALAVLSEIVLRKEFKIGPYYNDGSGIPAEIALFVPLACMFAVPYVVWLWFRTSRTGQRSKISWAFPLFLGIAYFPLLFGAIWLFITVTGLGQGTIIGTFVGACVFGFPVAFAEICFRVARRRGDKGEGTSSLLETKHGR
jgi:hypothetical protein